MLTLEDQRYLLDFNNENAHVEEGMSKDKTEDAVISANVLKDSHLSLFPQYGLLGTICLAGNPSLWPASEKHRGYITIPTYLYRHSYVVYREAENRTPYPAF